MFKDSTIVFDPNFGWIIRKDNLYFKGKGEWDKLSDNTLGFKSNDKALEFIKNY
jgi:hypothetical protein